MHDCWFLQNGSEIPVNNSYLHAETAIRWCKKNDKNSYEFIKNNIFDGEEPTFEYDFNDEAQLNNTTEYLIDSKNWIRFSSPSSFTLNKIEPKKLNIISEFLQKNQGSIKDKEKIYIDELSDFNCHEFTMEDLKEANFNIAKAILIAKNRDRMYRKFSNSNIEINFTKAQMLQIGEQAGWSTNTGSENQFHKKAILTQRVNKNNGQKEYCLVSRDKKRVLEWYGKEKPSEDKIDKTERRVQYFKNKS